MQRIEVAGKVFQHGFAERLRLGRPARLMQLQGLREKPDRSLAVPLPRSFSLKGTPGFVHAPNQNLDFEDEFGKRAASAPETVIDSMRLWMPSLPLAPIGARPQMTPGITDV